ncbi:unnamed protein product [Heligmosomoides polygyrus]|uniref:FRIGIDA-like protein n=1 Tax=Heligmosomoides polygyrus TaxID=6339 RepID=A0A183FQ87_HELPZ|nr:unnamed protein product [Heligmosomoides polygyrus]
MTSIAEHGKLLLEPAEQLHEVTSILYGLRKFEDFRNVLPILDLVKEKFPSEAPSKLHDLAFQTGEEFDIDAVMRRLETSSPRKRGTRNQFE